MSAPMPLARLFVPTLALATLAGCAAPLKPVGADAARAELRALQTDARLAAALPPLVEAEAATVAAEQFTRDTAAGEHAVYVAERRIALARSAAEKRLAENDLQRLKQQRDAIQADARIREAEIAQDQAEAAAAAAAAQLRAAQQAQIQAAAAQQATEELRRQMQALQAEATDRGMVMTLGDVLFATGKSDLAEGAHEKLDQLAAFLHRYTDRTLLIEGHTDAQGTAENNLALSQRRAEAVKVYLIIQSIDASRLTAVGRGSEAPIADNTTPEGRQRNRRVEIVIGSP